MLIHIQTKNCKLSPRMRRRIEAYTRRVLRREVRQIRGATLTIRPSTLGGEPGFGCKVQLRSHYLGNIVVEDISDTLRSTTQQVMARARHAFRRKLHKRLSKYRRIQRPEFAPWRSHGTSTQLESFRLPANRLPANRWPNRTVCRISSHR